MALNKSSKFGVTEGLVFGKTDIQEEQQEHEVQKEHEAQQAQDVQEYLEYGTTQGRKGKRAKRINMAFSDKNYEYIKKQSRWEGLSATAFVNMIIDNYKKDTGGEKERILKRLEATVNAISLLIEDEKYGFKANLTYEQEELIRAIQRCGERDIEKFGKEIKRERKIDEEILNEMISANKEK